MYNELLEGLEISEISNLELERTTRLDSEFYKRENLITLDLLKRHEILNLTQIVEVSDGNHNAISEKFQESGVPYYRGQDVSSFFVENADPICIDVETFHLPVMKRSHLKKGDVLLSIVGTIGKLSLVYSDEKATCSCKLAILRPFNVSAEFLAVFLESKYGQNQIKKFTRGAVQMGLILEDANQIFVPTLSNSFQQKIETLVKSAHTAQENSKGLYQTAENLLLSELGIDENIFKVSKNEVVTNEKSFADLEDAFRFDSEYYQPKYDLIHEKIKSYKGGFAKLEQCLKELQTGEYAGEYQTKNESLSYFIRNTNVKKTQIVVDENYAVLPENFKKFTEEGDILTARVGAIGLFGVVRKDSTDCVYSDNVLNIRLIDKLNPEVYCCYFSTKVNFELVDRIAGGSVQPLITQTSIKDLVIPIFPNEIQVIVLEKIQESFRLKTHSEQLLNLAKRAVEIAIEEGEDEAMAWIGERQ